MDRLEFRMLKLLLLNNGVPPGNPVLRKSFRSIAKELGVDQGTVRKRMKIFQDQEILKGWYLGVSPGVTGNDVVHAWFDVKSESAKPGLIKTLLSFPELERVCNYLGPKLSFVLYSKKGLDPDAAMQPFAELASHEAALHKRGVVQVDPCATKEIDLDIIASLRRDPWKQYAIVAKEVRLSERTVKRRVAKLSENRAVYMLPIIDLKALQGVIAVEIVVDHVSQELRATANQRIMLHEREGLVFADTSGPYGYFALTATNVSQVEQIASWVRQQEGVGRVRTEVLQDVILNPRHYERES